MPLGDSCFDLATLAFVGGYYIILSLSGDSAAVIFLCILIFGLEASVCLFKFPLASFLNGAFRRSERCEPNCVGD